jgi:hypothetical protein
VFGHEPVGLADFFFQHIPPLQNGPGDDEGHEEHKGETKEERSLCLTHLGSPCLTHLCAQVWANGGFH